MLETNLRQSLLISQGDLGIFLVHPIAATLLAVALVVVVASVLVRLRRRLTVA
jgi:putative tricarboxylic transport membrane protein